MKNRLGLFTAFLAIFVLTLSACQSDSVSPTTPDRAELGASGHASGAIVVRNTGNGPFDWQFIDEGDGNADGDLVSGPGSPPLGSGSAEFVLGNGGEAMSLQNFNPRFVGTRLDAIDELEYCTYVESAPGTQAVSLQLNFDDDVTDSDDGWKGRIVFEPANNQDQQSVTDDTWQCWDADAGQWWSTAGLFGTPKQDLTNNKTFSEILTTFPDAGINSKFGGVVLKAGSGWSSFDGNADALTIIINGAQTTYDFEAPQGRR